MRIIGGARKGRKLAEWHDLPIRPLRDRVRTALFDVLKDVVSGVEFLDLFAGTGAVGLEALSRGAGRATFVERSPRVALLLRENVRRLGYEDKSRIIIEDALQSIRCLADHGDEFDLVFVGAPYGTPLARQALQCLSHYVPLSSQAIVVVEVHAKQPLTGRCGPLELALQREYGDTQLNFFQFAPERSSD